MRLTRKGKIVLLSTMLAASTVVTDSVFTPVEAPVLPVSDAAVLLGYKEPVKPTPIPTKTATAIKKTTLDDRRAAAASRADRNRSLGRTMAALRGWTGSEWGCLNTLWYRESKWDHKAENDESGAYGIPQNITGGSSKYRRYASEQIRWGLDYIKHRYGTPCKALSHSNRKGWY